MDITVTAVGSATIPLKESGKLYRIVRLQTIDRNGRTEDIGDFSLTDLLNALNAKDAEVVKVEEAHYAGHLRFRECSQ